MGEGRRKGQKDEAYGLRVGGAGSGQEIERGERRREETEGQVEVGASALAQAHLPAAACGRQ